MNIEQLLNSKSKEEAVFITYSKCVSCHNFYEDEYGSWKCGDPWNEGYCRRTWEDYLKLILDKNNYGNK